MPPLNTFTTKAKNAIRRAHEIAMERGQSHVTPQHLFLSILLNENENIILLILEKQNIDYNSLTDFLFDAIDGEENEKTLTPSYQMFLTKELVEAFVKSADIAKTMGDKFISSEHLFMAILDSTDEKTLEIKEYFNIKKEEIAKIFEKIKKGTIKVVITKKNKFLNKYTKDLTQEAFDGKLDPVIGRENEIKKIIEIISRRSKSNPVLIGEPGVGKTAIVEGLAQKIITKKVPENLINKKILSLDLGSLISGTKFRGEFEERLKGAMKEIEESSGDIILFIDELHMIMGAGSSEGSLDASNLLKPALARKNFSLIGATTFSEYQKFIQKDGALTRRFSEVKILEPTIDDSIKILIGLKKTYEIYHNIEIKNEAIVSAVTMSDRYITDRKLPDKAVDILDIASAKAKILNYKKPKILLEIEKEILELKVLLKNKLKKTSIKDGKSDFDIEKKIADLKEEEREIKTFWKEKRDYSVELKNIKKAIKILENELKNLYSRNNIKNKKESENNYENNIAEDISIIKEKSLPVLKSREKEIENKISFIEKKSFFTKEIVDEELILKVISSQTGIPLGKIKSSSLERLKKIEDILNSEIIGQERAIKKISQAIKVSQVNISDPNKPAGSFVFLGQTGTGKTELAKKIAENLFEKKESFIRVDMQELMEGHSVSKLIGSPPGYVGFDEGGGLTEKVKNNPYSVILFDEVEKANPEILNILLQILDEGKLTDSKGREVDFKNSIIIMTSNIGSEFFNEVGSIGFETNIDEKKDDKKDDRKFKKARKNILNSLSDYFAPEFLNRIDEFIIFNTLKKDDIIKILNLQMQKQKAFLKNRISLKVSKKAINELVDISYSDQYGARDVKRNINKKIISKLAEFLIDNDNPDPKKYKITFSIDFDLKKKEFLYDFKKIKKIKK